MFIYVVIITLSFKKMYGTILYSSRLNLWHTPCWYILKLVNLIIPHNVVRSSIFKISRFILKFYYLSLEYVLRGMEVSG